MPHVAPLKREDLADFEPLFEAVEGVMGFVPNSFLTMGRRPEVLQAFATLAGTVLRGGTLTPELKQLVAYTASNAAGCRYCQAHTSHSAAHAGATSEKIQAVWELETSELFDPRERAALRLARDAGLTPNQTDDGHFRDLEAHFSAEEIVELVAVISLFGFLNRWNDTMATELEERPTAFAGAHLAPGGWALGKHGRG
jgi:uncharacterized peroxidase-related enzyme